MSYTKLKDDCTIMFDVDNTLVMWDLEEHDDTIIVEHEGWNHRLRPHKKHIEMIKTHFEKGHIIIVHSAAGSDWAEKIINVLELDNYVHSIQTKPYKHYDDMDCKTWMGDRVFYPFRNEDHVGE